MTTRESKIIEITKVIQAAVPDVVDNQFMYNSTLVADICKNCCEYSSECTCKEGENIGICEILLWLKQFNTYSVDVDGDIAMYCYGDIMKPYGKYNLHKDTLDQQSDELIDFLFTFTQS